MSVKSDKAEALRREKARNLRYKRAVLADLNLETIQSTLYEIAETASDVKYWCADEDETQLDELIGDEEETFELKMAFSTLEADCEQMQQDMDNEWVPEFFDDFFGAIAGGGAGEMMGYDRYAGDYFGLSGSWEAQQAQKECEKRLLAHTKQEIVEAYSICFRVAVNYIALKDRYDGLKAYIDILHGQNTGLLQTVKRIEELYDKTSDCGLNRWEDEKEFAALLDSLPQEVWLQ